MIDKLRGMALFAAVVEQGTFRGAARHLKLAPSRMSQAVSDLERELGVTLLYRSTRQLSLTHEGRLLYDSVRRMLEAAETGLDAINPMAAEPSGALRVTVPAFVAQTDLMDALAGFARAHPKVRLDLHFSDRQQDLIRDGYDVAIRAGWLEDNELRTRKIGNAERMLVASPGYVASKPEPAQAADLEHWDWIRFVVRPDFVELTSPEGLVVPIRGQSHLSVDTADSLYEFAVRGLGLTVIPESFARRGIERGELVQVLPGWTLRALGLHALWPDQSRRENLTLTFIRFLAGALEQ